MAAYSVKKLIDVMTNLTLTRQGNRKAEVGPIIEN
jgi:hypothetical protein